MDWCHIAIIWANVDQYLCCLIVSLGHNELQVWTTVKNNSTLFYYIQKKNEYLEKLLTGIYEPWDENR